MVIEIITLQLQRPRFADIPVDSVFSRPDQPGYAFLKISRLMYVWGWNEFTHSWAGNVDRYCPDPDLRVDVLEHPRGDRVPRDTDF